MASDEVEAGDGRTFQGYRLQMITPVYPRLPRATQGYPGLPLTMARLTDCDRAVVW